MTDIRSSIATRIGSVAEWMLPGGAPWTRIADDVPQLGRVARPVVFHNGFSMHPAAHEPVKRLLTAARFDVTMAHPPRQTLGGIDGAVESLEKAVVDASNRSMARGGDGLVNVLAHSWGALVAREWIQNRDGIDLTAQLVTLGGVNQGFLLLNPTVSGWLGKYAPIPALRALERTHGVANQLNETLPKFMDEAAVRQPGFTMTSIGTDAIRGSDGLITVAATRLPEARNTQNHIITSRLANHASNGGIVALHRETMQTTMNLLAGYPLEQSVSGARRGERLLYDVSPVVR